MCIRDRTNTIIVVLVAAGVVYTATLCVPTSFAIMFLKFVAISYSYKVSASLIAISSASLNVTAPVDPATDTQFPAIS